MGVAQSIVVVGEALMDCAFKSVGGEVSEVPGGSPMNVAIGLGRLGHRVTLATRVGRDDRGSRIVDHIRSSNVDVMSGALGAQRTSSARAMIAEDGSATYEFELVWDITPEMVEPGDYLHVHTGSLAATLPPGASAVWEIVTRERESGASVSYDPNARPHVMGNPGDVLAQVEAIIAISDLVKASDDDVAWLYPGWTLEEVAAQWKSLGALLVVITRGPLGATAWGAGSPVSLPARATLVEDTIGAGDAVMAGLISALSSSGLLGSQARGKLAELTGDDLAGVLNFALAVAAVTVSRAGANPPTRAEMDRVV